MIKGKIKFINFMNNKDLKHLIWNKIIDIKYNHQLGVYYLYFRRPKINQLNNQF